MYNQDRKNQYILEIGSGNLAPITTYFNSCEPIEEALGKDISCFNTKEIVGFYKSLSTPSRYYLSTINSQLSQYTSWCQNNGFLPDKQNHFNEISLSMLEECINRALLEDKYVSWTRLEKILKSNQFVNPSSNFLVLALFEGICGKEYEEIRQLEPKDFDGKELILSDTRHFKVSDYLKDLARQSAQEYVYYQFDDMQRTRQFDRSDGRCYKNLSRTGDPSRENLLIIARLKRLSEVFGYKFIHGRALLESGRIYMIKKLMKESGDDVRTCILNNLEEIEMRYGRLQSVSSYCVKYKDIFERGEL